MAALMPLSLTVSCFSKIQIGFTFLVLAHLSSSGKRAVKRVCVCVCVSMLVFSLVLLLVVPPRSPRTCSHLESVLVISMFFV